MRHEIKLTEAIVQTMASGSNGHEKAQRQYLPLLLTNPDLFDGPSLEQLALLFEADMPDLDLYLEAYTRICLKMRFFPPTLAGRPFSYVMAQLQTAAKYGELYLFVHFNAHQGNFVPLVEIPQDGESFRPLMREFIKQDLEKLTQARFSQAA